MSEKYLSKNYLNTFISNSRSFYELQIQTIFLRYSSDHFFLEYNFTCKMLAIELPVKITSKALFVVIESLTCTAEIRVLNHKNIFSPWICSLRFTAIHCQYWTITRICIFLKSGILHNWLFPHSLFIQRMGWQLSHWHYQEKQRA